MKYKYEENCEYEANNTDEVCECCGEWNNEGCNCGGYAGITGPTGPAGPAGPRGLQGPAGSQGPAGPAGPQGPGGVAGQIGATGPAGPQGPQGVVGATGTTGPAGPQGLQGPVGPVGAQGDVGPAGPQGPVGAQGPQGDIGPVGPQGSQGPAGIRGPVGPQGPTGPQGPQGIISAFGEMYSGAQEVGPGCAIPFVGQIINGNTISHQEGEIEVYLEANHQYYISFKGTAMIENTEAIQMYSIGMAGIVLALDNRQIKSTASFGSNASYCPINLSTQAVVSIQGNNKKLSVINYSEGCIKFSNNSLFILQLN